MYNDRPKNDFDEDLRLLFLRGLYILGADYDVGAELLVIGEANDVAQMVYTVAKSNFINGAIINVDGGLRHIGPEQMLSEGSGGWSAEAPGGGLRPDKL